jgi:type IV secretory pathway VirB6-like protein
MMGPARRFSWLGLWLVVAALMVVLPAPYVSQAYAQDKPEGTPVEGNLETVDKDGQVIKCADASDHKGIQLGQGALLGKIMPCLMYTVEKSTERFTAKMVEMFRPLLYSFLAVVIVLFGVRVLQNEPQVYKQGFVLVLKVTIVLAILNDLGGTHSISNVSGSGDLIPAVYNIMAESQEVVASAIDSTNLTCDVASYSNQQEMQVWSIMDCVMGKLFGFMVGTDGKGSMLLATSMFGVLAGFFFGGGWGVVVFFGMLGVLFGLFMLVARTAAVFISSYLLICLMLIISPLLLPLVFLKGTEKYYERLWINIMSGFLSPIIVTGYVVLSLMVYDKMLFAPDAIVQKIFDWEIISKAQQTTKSVYGGSITGKPLDLRLDEAATSADAADKLMKAPTLQNTAAGTLSAASAFGLKAPELNIESMGPEFEKGKETFRKMFTELASLFILAWMINQGLSRISLIVSQLTRAGSAVRGIAAVDSFEKKMMGAGEQAMQGMRSAYKDSSRQDTVKGKEFLERTSAATNTGRDAFMQAMRKK